MDMDIDNEATLNCKEESVKVDDEEDPVVHEIPIFLSKGVNCYLFQYPIRPASMPYDNSEVIRSKFRPTNQQVELELKLNTSNANYDRSKGEQIALNVDGSKTGVGNDRTFHSSVMHSID